MKRFPIKTKYWSTYHIRDRSIVIPINLGFAALIPALGIVHAALVVGLICMLLALWATSRVAETYDKDLDYVE